MLALPAACCCVSNLWEAQLLLMPASCIGVGPCSMGCACLCCRQQCMVAPHRMPTRLVRQDCCSKGSCDDPLVRALPAGTIRLKPEPLMIAADGLLRRCRSCKRWSWTSATSPRATRSLASSSRSRSATEILQPTQLPAWPLATLAGPWQHHHPRRALATLSPNQRLSIIITKPASLHEPTFAEP